MCMFVSIGVQGTLRQGGGVAAGQQGGLVFALQGGGVILKAQEGG